MIVIVAKIHTTAAGIEGMKDAIAEMQAASQAEAGCSDYTFCVELGDPDTLRINECWDDVAALESHFATEHMATFNQAMAGAAPRNVSLACYEANEIPFPIKR
jgi:quinol monooxygenase YgiN